MVSYYVPGYKRRFRSDSKQLFVGVVPVLARAGGRGGADEGALQVRCCFCLLLIPLHCSHSSGQYASSATTIWTQHQTKSEQVLPLRNRLAESLHSESCGQHTAVVRGQGSQPALAVGLFTSPHTP